MYPLSNAFSPSSVAAVPLGRTAQSSETGNSSWMERILLVEDDAALRAVLHEFLAEQGYSVVTACDGMDALEKIDRNQFGIVLSDLWMPRLSGDLLYRAVEKTRPELCERFIFMSAQRETGNVVKFIDSIGRTILAKPFHVDDLLEVIAFIRVCLTIKSVA